MQPADEASGPGRGDAAAAGERREPPGSFQVLELKGGKPPFAMTLGADGLELVSPDGAERIQVPSGQRAERVLLQWMPGFKRTFVVETDRKKRRSFHAPDDATFDALRAWLGPPTVETLRATLKRSFTASLPIGIVFVLTSLPMMGLPADWIGLWLGLTLIMLGPAARRFPHRTFFLLNGFWMLVLAGQLVHRSLSGTSSLLWLLLLWLHALVIVESIRSYKEFAPERMAGG